MQDDELYQTEIPGNLAPGEQVQVFDIPAPPSHTPGPWTARAVPNVGLRGHTGYAIDYNEAQEQVVDFVYTEPDARLIAQAPTLLQDLTDAAAQLRKYETLHRAKTTPDSLEKAEVNASLAARFEATIAAAAGG